MSEPVRLEIGEIAPDFELQNQDGKKFKLSSLRGKKVILYFFPAALTPGCTREASDFNDSLGYFKKAGYTVVSVSPDSVAKLKKFQAAENLKFPLLSDEDIAAHKLYGAFGEKALYGRLYKGVLRSTIVIDEAGVITLALYRVKATGHVAMLKRKMGLEA